MAMQLDFSLSEPEGEAAAATTVEEPRVFSVGELTRAVRDVLEGEIGEVWVQGEVSNHRKQASGHQYFTLKDAGSQVSCVLFAGSARRAGPAQLADGVEVQVFGDLTVYEARGQYQLVVRQVREAGVGALQAQFEALKARLAAEGLFDVDRKRELPRFPRRIGLVTSPTGAAVRDFLNVLTRRMPGVGVLVHPVRVQGKGAAAEIAAAVRDFSVEGLLPAVDLVVVTRGGGSLEDLWEFNEEVVARAIAESAVPVVNAVGHEIDFTIADFAADLRAPTPSAAAELIVPDGAELRRVVEAAGVRLRRELGAAVRFARTRLEGLVGTGLARVPERVLRERCQVVDGLAEDLLEALKAAVRERRERVRHAGEVLRARRPDAALAVARGRLFEIEKRLRELAARRVADERRRVESALGLLAVLSPRATLERGFTMTVGADGKLVRRAAEVAAGDELVTRFADGDVGVRVR